MLHRPRCEPTHLNKLEAHIALFRALPSSARHIWEQDIRSVTENWRSKYIGGKGPGHNRSCNTEEDHSLGIHVKGNSVHRPRSGVLINVLNDCSGAEAQSIHRMLLDKCKSPNNNSFLSDQDIGGFRPHYTIMNKVDDQAAIDTCISELQHWPGSRGRVNGFVAMKI